MASRQVHRHNRGGHASPGRFHGGTTLQNHHGVGVFTAYALDQAAVAARHHHELAIKSFGLEPIRQAGEHHGDVMRARRLDRLLNLNVGRLARIRIISRGERDRDTAAFELVQRAIELTGIDFGRAGTLEARLPCKGAYNGDRLGWVKRQDTVVFK